MPWEAAKKRLNVKVTEHLGGKKLTHQKNWQAFKADEDSMLRKLREVHGLIGEKGPAW